LTIQEIQEEIKEVDAEMGALEYQISALKSERLNLTIALINKKDKIEEGE